VQPCSFTPAPSARAVDQAVAPAGDEIAGQHPHETGQADQLDIGSLKGDG
jgi:hypothetical protein